jgi:hypothetical protein
MIPFWLGGAYEALMGRSGLIPKYEEVDPKVHWGIRHSAADFLEEWADALRGHVERKPRERKEKINPYNMEELIKGNK